MAAQTAPTEWNPVSKAFHWAIFVLIIALLVAGEIMVDMPKGPEKTQIYGLHKATGLLVLLLATARLGWRQTHPRPDLPAGMKDWERDLAHANHWMLYVAMFVMPLSGYTMACAYGFVPSFYGLFTAPDIVGGKNEVLGGLAGAVHWTTGWAIVGLLAMHAVGAGKHFFVNKDRVVQRMLPWGSA